MYRYIRMLFEAPFGLISFRVYIRKYFYDGNVIIEAKKIQYLPTRSNLQTRGAAQTRMLEESSSTVPFLRLNASDETFVVFLTSGPDNCVYLDV